MMILDLVNVDIVFEYVVVLMLLGDYEVVVSVYEWFLIFLFGLVWINLEFGVFYF